VTTKIKRKRHFFYLFGIKDSRYKFFSLNEKQKQNQNDYYAWSTGRTSGCDCATKRMAHLFGEGF